jgi:hypothetical protein
MHVGSEVVKLRATDVLLAVMQHDTESLRQFLTTQKECMLLSLLVSCQLTMAMLCRDATKDPAMHVATSAESMLALMICHPRRFMSLQRARVMGAWLSRWQSCSS